LSIPSIGFLGSLRDFRRTWPQLVLIDLLARGLGIVAISPFVAGLVKLFLLRTEDGVLTDADIAVFLLHPLGLLAALVVGSISLTLLFAKQGAAMVIGYGALNDRRVTWLDAVRYVARRVRPLVVLGGVVIVRGSLVAAPFLAAIGGVYLRFLGEYDINYYLAYRTPEFRQALALAAIAAAGLALVLLYLFARWILALPLVLFEGMGGRAALRESTRRTRGFVGGIMLWVAAWLALLWVVSSVALLLIGQLGRLLLPDTGSTNYALMLGGIALTLLSMGLANLAVAVFGASFFPLALVRLHCTLGGSGGLAPEEGIREPLREWASFRIPGKGLLLAGCVGVVGVSIAAWFAIEHLDAEDEVTVIAHRGASVAAPENTLAAFRESITQSTDWIELDVQENADGEVIVAHDSDFMKVAGNPLKVWDATNDQLRRIDIGSWFAPEFSSERPPTLRRALELARGQAGVVIELKYYGHDERLESRVVEIIEATEMVPNVKLMSLDRKGLATFAALRPNWPRGLLNTASVGNLTRLDVDFLALNAAAATSMMIRRAHGQGMEVYVWTVNDPVRMSVMMSRGVDGIITDEPRLARRVLEFRENLTPLGRLAVWIAGETGLLQTDEGASDKTDA